MNKNYRVIAIFDGQQYKKEFEAICDGASKGGVIEVGLLDVKEASPTTLIEFLIEKKPESPIEFLEAHQNGDYEALDQWEEWVEYKKEGKDG